MRKIVEVIKRALTAAMGAVGRVRVPGGGFLAKAWGYVASGILAVLASVYEFVASPKVWLAGVSFFVAGWLAAFSFGNVPKRPVDRSAVTHLENQIAIANNSISRLTADLGEARARAAAAEAKVAEIEKAPVPVARPVYRPRKPAEPKAADPFAINWPKLP